MNAAIRWGVFFFLWFAAPSIMADDKAGNRADLWIDVYRGEPIRYREVLADLAKADVIYLGEQHRIVRHHEIQERIVADLGKMSFPLAVGLEQMEACRQPDLDRFNRGEIGFDELAAATDWADRWGNYRQYRPILETARKLKAPVVALNAKAETIRQVARSGGVEKLPPELRKELPAEMQLQDPNYEKALSLELLVHAAAMPNLLRPMIEAQMARDEAMAQAICAFLQSDAGKGRKMIVLCGGGHVARGLGTPARVRRRMPAVKERIVLLSESGEATLTPAERAMASDIEISREQLRELNQPIADYLGVKPLADEKANAPECNPKIPEEIERAMLGKGIFESSRLREFKPSPPEIRGEF
ncbi:MAG: ChaN family lipoprotein [Pirellulales bacterium]|nr:ChaN family lipoprotein [Pirellulales bacterium]